uniref:Helicase ATP-binding domain-containing protein n=1 Tax=Panagrellus redivivus TaxID=6233 RepID=A0A7E4ZSA8_PANRE
MRRNTNRCTEAAFSEEAESERWRRLDEQPMENNGILISNVENEEGHVTPKLKQVVLDDDRGTKKPNPVSVHEHFVKALKPHQAYDIKFMYDNVFESLERFRKDDEGGGCILAHGMGLGKTLQVVAFVHTLLSHSELSAEVTKILIVVPNNVVLNWRSEFKNWLNSSNVSLEFFDVMELDTAKSDEDRWMRLKNWHRGNNPSVMIMGYDMFRILTQREEDRSPSLKPKKVTHKERKFMEMQLEFRKYLQNPGPDMIICDEDHKLKNDESELFKTMMHITTCRRVCLTGISLQENLNECYGLVTFVKPGLLGLKSEFTNRFSAIIDRGRTSDASPAEVSLMKRRYYALFKLLKHVVQRQDISILKAELPPKLEYVVIVRMTPAQIKLYDLFTQIIYKAPIRKRHVRYHFNIASRIWNHPYLLILRSREHRQWRDEEDEKINEILGFDSDDFAYVDPWYVKADAVSENDNTNWGMSNKFMLLVDIIKACERVGDKLVVLSQSLEALRLIKVMLEDLDRRKKWFDEGHEAMGQNWGWKEGYDYLFIDGFSQRSQFGYLRARFNDPTNLRARLILISTESGPLGTNVAAANRVIIFDAGCNPSHDTQSLFGVYCIGQKKPTFVYRFIAQGTMEECIYNHQVTKESTSLRVVDEQQIQRHFDIHGVEELYRFEPVPYVAGDELKLNPPKDRLLADLIRARPQGIVTYIPHDTLFVNQADEELTEEESKAAWDDYEREKRSINVNALKPVLNNALNNDDMLGLSLQTVLGIPQGGTLNGVPIDLTHLKDLEVDPVYRLAATYKYTPKECAKLGYIKLIANRLTYTALPHMKSDVDKRIEDYIVENVNNHGKAVELSMKKFHWLLPLLSTYTTTHTLLFRISRYAPWLLIPPADRSDAVLTEWNSGALGGISGADGNASDSSEESFSLVTRAFPM